MKNEPAGMRPVPFVNTQLGKIVIFRLPLFRAINSFTEKQALEIRARVFQLLEC
jgi:hypothetical protein